MCYGTETVHTPLSPKHTPFPFLLTPPQQGAMFALRTLGVFVAVASASTAAAGTTPEPEPTATQKATATQKVNPWTKVGPSNIGDDIHQVNAVRMPPHPVELLQ